jgi:alcohol dehydrogenase (cytochrome c)
MLMQTRSWNPCLILALLAAGPAASQTGPSFTAAQVIAGQSSYVQSCARCHGARLDDGEFGPALRGEGFTALWAGHSVAELFGFIQRSMPPDAAASLSGTTTAQVVAYILSRNEIAPVQDVMLSEDLATLATWRLPGQPPSLPGPSGGLAPGVVLPPWPAQPNPLDHLTAVDDLMLSHADPRDWLTWRGGHDDAGYSPLKQINRDTVRQLGVAWALALPPGANEATPLVHDGVIFIRAPDDSVLALDGASGAQLWRYARQLPSGTAPATVRNMALNGTRLYLGTSDAHVVALNASTGALVWDHAIEDPAVWRISGGPLVAQGKVMQGVTGRGPGGAFILGLDAANGNEVWRFHSIAQPGDPGDKTWNDTPLERRNGGSVWTAGSYDGQLKLAFFGIAQTYDTAPLLHAVKKRGISNDGLYLDSTIALDPDTGKPRWTYQHLPNDQWDYDFAFERQIIQLPLRGQAAKLILTAGKPAIYDALEAATGRYAFSIDLGLQNVITSIDPKTGAKHIDPARYPDQRHTFTVCPHAGGAKSWIPGSYNPITHVVYVPLVESCMDMIPTAAGEHGSLSAGFRWALRPRPDSDGRYGRVEAVDLITRKPMWTSRQRAPQTSGVLDTAGGIVFAGALDRSFAAYDDSSGSILWKYILSDVPSAAPISYAINGRQYVAMVVGYGGPQSATFPALVPEISLPPARSSALWVFALTP